MSVVLLSPRTNQKAKMDNIVYKYVHKHITNEILFKIHEDVRKEFNIEDQSKLVISLDENYNSFLQINIEDNSWSYDINYLREKVCCCAQDRS